MGSFLQTLGTLAGLGFSLLIAKCCTDHPEGRTLRIEVSGAGRMSVSPEHKVKVLRLYRHSLKHLMSWAIRRNIFAEEVRSEPAGWRTA